MASLADELAQMIAPGERPLVGQIRRVTQLNEGNTVNLDYGTPVVEVPCSSGYPDRDVDDIVLVVRMPSGGLLVLGKVGAAAKTRGEGDTGGAGAQVEVPDEEPVAKPPVNHEEPDPVEPVPPKVPDVVPKPYTAKPTVRRGYRASGQQDEGTPKQASWSGEAWRGAWFYGGRIKNACDGKDVAKMTVTLTRSGSGGWNRKVPVRLYLHNDTTPGSMPSSIGDVWTPGYLEPGGSITSTLPSSWRDKLASGAAEGFVAKASGSDEYIIFGSSSGSVKITYK